MPRKPKCDDGILRVSVSKLLAFNECARCFYLDVKDGVRRPSGFPFLLNSAVDRALKNEFDGYRKTGQRHPLLEKFGVEAVPFSHPELNKWRDTLHGGMTFLHKELRIQLKGAIDDIWVGKNGALHVVDFKASARSSEMTLDSPQGRRFGQQLECYVWIYRNCGFEMSDTSYILYVNARPAPASFNNRLEFEGKVISRECDVSWIEGALRKLRGCIDSPIAPKHSDACDLCRYQLDLAKYRSNGNQVAASL